MCGIVGVISPAGPAGYSIHRDKLVQALLHVDQLRGHDATGLFAIADPRGRPRILKRAMPYTDFSQMRETTTFFEYEEDAYPTIVGHNRFATQGPRTSGDAHPFQFDGITLVHNGTIPTFGTYSQQLPATGLEVDSECIAWLLANSPKQQYPDIFAELHQKGGSFALVWHDAQEGTLNFLRNEERPFWFGETDEDELIFASEQWMLEAGCAHSKRLLMLSNCLEPQTWVQVTLNNQARDNQPPASDKNVPKTKTVAQFKWSKPPRQLGRQWYAGYPGYSTTAKSAAQSADTSQKLLPKNDFLKKLQVEVGQLITFKPLQFVRFPNTRNGERNAYGKLSGTATVNVDGSKVVPVKAFLVHEEFAAFVLEESRVAPSACLSAHISGTTSAAGPNGTVMDQTLVVDPKTLACRILDEETHLTYWAEWNSAQNQILITPGSPVG